MPYPLFLTSFKTVAKEIGLLDMVPSEARHSGVSIEVSQGLRTLPEAQKHCKWMSQKKEETILEGQRDKQGAATLFGKPRSLFPGLRTRSGTRASRKQAASRLGAPCFESRGAFEDEKALTCHGRHGDCSLRLGKHLQLNGATFNLGTLLNRALLFPTCS